MAGAKKESKKKVKNPTSMEEIAANIQTQREFVTCGADENRHTAEHQYSGAYASMGIDNSFSMQSFRENFKMEITHMDAERVVSRCRASHPQSPTRSAASSSPRFPPWPSRRFTW